MRLRTSVPLICAFILYAVLPSSPARGENGPRNPAWATPVTLPHVENFHMVAPGIYRSAQPDAKAMVELYIFGIRTVINLRAFHSDDKEAENTRLILKRVPINTWDIEEDEIVAALRLLQTAEKPVLVHCQHGADRTGLVMAMYRMTEQGWSREAALDEMRNGGYGFHSVWKNIVRYLETVDAEQVSAKVHR